jgi:hypothetical protein
MFDFVIYSQQRKKGEQDASAEDFQKRKKYRSTKDDSEESEDAAESRLSSITAKIHTDANSKKKKKQKKDSAAPPAPPAPPPASQIESITSITKQDDAPVPKEANALLAEKKEASPAVAQSSTLTKVSTSSMSSLAIRILIHSCSRQ